MSLETRIVAVQCATSILANPSGNIAPQRKLELLVDCARVLDAYLDPPGGQSRKKVTTTKK